MNISKHDKKAMYEIEFMSLILIIVLGLLFYNLSKNLVFYLITLLIGFALFFWMFVEENLHKKGRKHVYFEYTSSYIMVGQTALTLGLLFINFEWIFLSLISFLVSVIMYGVSLSRIVLYKAMFKLES